MAHILRGIGFRLHPSGEFQDGLPGVVPFFLAGKEHPAAVFTGSHADYTAEMPVEIGDGSEAHHFGYGEDGFLCTEQQVAGLHDAGAVQVIQRAGPHDRMKDASEMSEAHMAYFRQVFHGKLCAVIILYIIQGG